MMKISKRIIFIVLLIISVESTYADGWVDDGYGNWLYEEKGEYVKNDVRTFDGVNYYFDTKGYWIPREKVADVKLKDKELTTFVIEGQDYKDRKFKVTVKIPMPIVSGKNEAAVNEFIRKEFQNAVSNFLEEKYINKLFLLTEIEETEMMEIYNLHDIIAFGYLGDVIFNLYVDTKNFDMWGMKD